MTDKERMDVCKDTVNALDRAKLRLDVATAMYLQEVQTYYNTVIEYLNDIQSVLKSE